MKLSNAELIDATTRDISDGGVFLRMGGDETLSVDDVVRVQVQGIPDGDAPWVVMRVVRVDPEGIALEMVEE